MKARRGAALAVALGSAAALAITVPLATADRGGGGHHKKNPPAAGAAGGVAPVATKPAKRALFEAVLSGQSRGKHEHHRGGSKGLTTGAGDPDGQGIATITVKDTQLCYALVTQGLGAIQSAEIDGKMGQKLLDLPVNVGAIGDPNAVAFCIVVGATGQYNAAGGEAGINLDKLRRKPEKFTVLVKTADFPSGAIAGKLRKVSSGKH
jgi:CHRD domain-containing protein